MFALALYLLGHANAIGKSAAGWTLVGGGGYVFCNGGGDCCLFRSSRMQAAAAVESEDCRSDPGRSSAELSPQLRAARYYASARALLTSADSSEQYHEAVTALDCMSKLRGDESTLPRVDYVRALELESTFQTNQPYAGLPLRNDLRDMTKQMEAVVDQYNRRKSSPLPAS